MRLEDIFWLSFRDLGEKKLRTALTIVMVVIGVASIVALISQTTGMSASISASLASLGPTSIILSPSGTTSFTVADTALLSTLPNVSVVIPLLTGAVTVYTNGQNSSATLIGITSNDLEKLLGGTAKLYDGSIYEDTITPSAVVGYNIAFPTTLAGRQTTAVGQSATLKIMSGRSAKTFTVPVAGILQEYGTAVVSVDSGIVVSLEAAETLLGRHSYSMIIVKTNSTGSVNATSSLIKNIYGSNVRVTNMQQMASTVASIMNTISMVLVVIAGISLLVAAIGIMNVMLIAVFERIHEIGIFKSLGFKNRHILMIFLFQALIIGILGGLIGILVGVGASYSLTAAVSTSTSASSASTSNTAATTTIAASSSYDGGPSGGGGMPSGRAPSDGGGGMSSSRPSSSSSMTNYSPVFTLQTILIAFLVAVAVSVIAGIYPAWMASRMEPIDALREL